MKEKIVEKCKQQMMNMQQPVKSCPKQPVYCMLVTTDGRQYFGSNIQANVCVDKCPRKHNENYDKCTSICNQFWHAEVGAIESCIQDNTNPNGSTLYLVGHVGSCIDCRTQAAIWNINKIIVIDKSARVYGQGQIIEIGDLQHEYSWL